MPKTVDTTIYNRSWLEVKRRKAGITQKEVANEIGCQVCVYNKIENGLYSPDVHTALKLADMFGFDVREFGNEKEIE